MKNTIKIFIIFGLLLLAAANLSAQVSGVVFRDFNGDGVRTVSPTYTEPGVAGVTVTGFPATGSPVVATSMADGSYNLAGLTGQVRVEFTIPATATCLLDKSFDFPGYQGDAYGSDVQFVTAGASTTNVNFPVGTPADYFPITNPSVFTPCYVAGNPSSASVGSIDAFVRFPYNSTGTTAIPTADKLATTAQVGSVWGVAFSRQADRLFTSAFLKRHVGLGPANGTAANAPGAIYMLNPALSATSSPTATSYLTSLDALGYPTHNSTGAPAYGSGTSYTITTAAGSASVTYPANGAGVLGTNAQRNLGNTPTSGSNDPAAYDQIGKVSLGDIALSDDGRFLFVVNLFDRKVYQLAVDNPTTPTAATYVNSWSLPNPPARSTSGVANAATIYSGATDGAGYYDGTVGVQRPWGLKYYRGKLYVGAVTTAENGGVNNPAPAYTDMWAYVYELDPTAGTWNSTPKLQFPMNFARGRTFTSNNVTTKEYPSGWFPWTNSLPSTGTSNFDRPSPILSDIDFDVDGSMVFNLMDRAGHQVGYANFRLSGNAVFSGESVGDILRAAPDGTCKLVLENNGTVGGITSAGANNTQGPGGGEFYFEDKAFISTSPNSHPETSSGGLAILPGSNEVISTVMDPLKGDQTSFYTGGIRWYSNTTGAFTDAFQLYASSINGGNGTGGKANGLGAIDFVKTTAPIMIGNHVWKDTNNNGIHDPTEVGIDGVQIALISGGSTITTKPTSNGGQFYFEVQPNTAYTIQIVDALNSGPLLGCTGISTQNTTALAGNDASLVGGQPSINYTTGNAGENNYGLDFGLISNPPCPSPNCGTVTVIKN